jgi:fatty-acyl-CoA synthase
MTDIGIGSWPTRRARMDPDAVAFRQGPAFYTYKQCAARVDAVAAGLANLGVGRGDRVAYLGPNDIATFETLFATGSLGAVFVPLNTRLAADEIAYMLTDCGARVLVYGPECATLVARAANTVVNDESVSAAAGSERPRLVALQPTLASDDIAYAELLASTHRAPRADVGLEDDAVILYTSGTTGRPKGAVLTHGNLTFNTINQLAQVDVLNQDIVVCTAPLFHVTGLGQVTMPAVFKGAAVIVAPRFDAGWLLRIIASERVNAFSAVPTMLQMMCDHPQFPSTDLSSLRYVIYGGSAVQTRVARAWLDRGVPLLQGYGLTEAAPGVFLAQPGGVEAHPYSAGVTQFYNDLALQNVDGTITGSRGTGELLVRGPTVFRGYHNRPEDTAKALGGGWLHTGDVVRIDSDGWAHVVDRTKDMFISGGENVYPAEVEAVLSTMADVAECAVVGVPDSMWGEVGLAVVVAAAGRVVDLDGVRAHLDGRLAGYKIPKHLQLVGQLPRTATGKIRKSELRQLADTAANHTTKEHA